MKSILNERKLVDELIDAAYNDSTRSAELCEILFGDATIAEEPTLAYTAAMAMQIVLRSGTRHQNFGRLTGWVDGQSKRVILSKK